MNTININDSEWKESGNIRLQIKGQNNFIEVSERKLFKNHVLNDFPDVEQNGELIITVNGNCNKVVIGSITIAGRLNIIITGSHNSVMIGDNNFVKRNLDVVIRPGGPNITVKNSIIRINTENWFNGNVTLDAGESNTKVEIGSYCLFANRVSCSTSDNHTIFDKNSGLILNKSGNVKISDHVWICTDALILNNSRIPQDSVVAARSILTKCFDMPNVVLAGAPAKIIKKDINWCQNLFENQDFVNFE